MYYRRNSARPARFLEPPLKTKQATSQKLTHGGDRTGLQLSALVAVGTTIAGRPPHRSVRARLRIRLLPRMNGVEAFIGIRMQNAGCRNPPVQQRVEAIPTHLGTLTATD